MNIKEHVTYQVYHTSPSEPDRDKERDQLSQSNGGGGLEDVEILQNIWYTHQPHGSQEPQANPCSVKVNGHK